MIENIYDEERPVGAAALDIGRNVARFTAWAGVAWIYDSWGWNAALTTASVLLVLFSLPGIIRAESPRPPSLLRQAPSLKRIWQRRESRYVYPICFLIALVGSLIPTLYPTYLSDLGFSVARIAAVAAPATLLGTVLGASATCWFIGRFGYKKTIATATVLIVPAVLPIMWMGLVETPTFLLVFVVTLNAIALPSFLEVSFQAARLKWASKTQAGTDYTTQIVTMTAGAGLAAAVGGVLAEHLGWSLYFITAGILVCAVCFLLYRSFDRIETLVDARDKAQAGLGSASAELQD
jgi:MFS transporter (putative signal transducer)